jgi:acyl carrier protein
MDKEKFLAELAEIFEEDVVNEEDVLAEYEAWDSLSILGIIAYASENLNITLNNKEIRDCETVADLMKLIGSK